MIKPFFRYHFEWLALFIGLLLMGMMDPYINNGHSLCLFEMLNIGFCPGDGLGHSIAFTFRGELQSALQAHFLGPAAVLILVGRIGYLWRQAYKSTFIFNRTEDNDYGQND